MRLLYTLITLLFSCCTIVFSQAVTINGTIKNNSDHILAGVTVTIKGSSAGIQSNQKGTFTITATTLPATLTFSLAGYKTTEYVVKGKDSTGNLNITLYQEATTLDEVVVVGYAAAKRKSIMSSVSYSKHEEAATALAGSVRGVSISEYKEARGRKPAYDSPGDSTVSRATSKVLTAGELSDFKKWEQWEGYTKEEFKNWSTHWDITPVNRYCVQVQNKERKALAGEKVYLLHASTRDTLWRAVTDNTGKAELWAGFDANKSAPANYSIACSTELVTSPVIFTQGINRITLNKDCNPSNQVDIAFVVDATGSMKDEIEYLQAELADVISRTSAVNNSVQLRVGSVFYRDHGDAYLTRSIDFQNTPSPLMAFIKEQSAGGGGDFPEAVDAALTTALDSLHWNATARTRLLFLVLDAPPHTEAAGKMKALIVQAATHGVRIVPVVCSGIDKPTEFLMRSVALATNGSYVFLTDDSGVGEKHIKPTTDYFKVELLNDLLQRLITEMSFMPPCNDTADNHEPVRTDNHPVTVSVYPNPSTGNIHIKSTETIKELFVTDFTGKILHRLNAASKATVHRIDLSNFPCGTYLVRYFIENKGWGTEKVMLVK